MVESAPPDNSSASTRSRDPSPARAGNASSQGRPEARVQSAQLGFYLFMGALIAVSVYVWVETAPSGEDAVFNAMPDPVLRWLETGQYVPAPRAKGESGERKRLYVNHRVVKEATETVLLVPDLSTSSYSFRSVIGKLETAGYTVVAFDPLGVGLSDGASSPVQLSDDGLAQAISLIYSRLQLRSAHLIVQGNAARAGLRFAEHNRPRVRSLMFVGVGQSGYSVHATPPFFGSTIGDRVLRVPLGDVALSHACRLSRRQWPCEPDILRSYGYLRGYRKDRSFLAAQSELTSGMRSVCGRECSTLFAKRLNALQINSTFISCRSSQCCRREGFGPDRPLDHRVKQLSNPTMAVPSEGAPAVLAEAITAFIVAQEPTPSKPIPELPDHIKEQLAKGGGHSHSHGHDHSHHGHAHMHGGGGGGHGFSGGNYGL